MPGPDALFPFHSDMGADGSNRTHQRSPHAGDASQAL